MVASIAVIRRQKQKSPIQSVHSLINKESVDDLIPRKIKQVPHYLQSPSIT
ncbi:hypothetical protein M2E15_2396 [Bacillus mycoides]|nr:hypothetical protein M2E15_2396 [Bacillus mycoides]